MTRTDRPGMSLHDRELMGRPSVPNEGRCCVCGRSPAQSHHVVPRGRGGADGPTVPLCGLGNASGCHGLAHSHRLHLDWRGGWAYLLTEGPCREDEALAMDGWAPVRKG